MKMLRSVRRLSIGAMIVIEMTVMNVVIGIEIPPAVNVLGHHIVEITGDTMTGVMMIEGVHVHHPQGEMTIEGRLKTGATADGMTDGTLMIEGMGTAVGTAVVTGRSFYSFLLPL